MTLLEAIQDLGCFDEDFTIYASTPWSVSSVVSVEYEPEEGSIPAKASKLGLVYFLEVQIAKELVEGWLANLNFKLSNEDICKRIIDYAESDA